VSRRENVLKATAGALQASSIDLTKLRRQSTRDPRRLKVRGDDAAGALAFAALDRTEKGELLRGDRLGPILLRLKYAEQHSRDLFQTAHIVLVHRHGGIFRRRPSLTTFALGYVAIFEWVHDPCPKCRGRASGKPVPKDGKGMRCTSCNNSGRVAFTVKRRWALVNDFIVSAQKREDAAPTGIDFNVFRAHWISRYHRYLEVLRGADRRIAGTLDLGMTASERSANDSGMEDGDGEQAEAP
jgi:hypothetical protein